MTAPQALSRYDNGPLYEVGLNLYFSSIGLVDPYDVRSLHDEFRTEFPKVEKHLPAQVSSRPHAIERPEDDHHRWFFISEDGGSIAQFQTNFLARNWRRQALPPEGDVKNYPGFEELLSGFIRQFKVVESHAKKRSVDSFAFQAAELFYDNFIPLGPDVRLKDIIVPIQIPYKAPVAELVCGWNEGLVGEPSADSYLRVEVRVIGAAVGDATPRSFVRLRLVARDSVQNFDEALKFFEQAHGLARTRLDALTTDSCRSTW